MERNSACDTVQRSTQNQLNGATNSHKWTPEMNLRQFQTSFCDETEALKASWTDTACVSSTMEPHSSADATYLLYIIHSRTSVAFSPSIHAQMAMLLSHISLSGLMSLRNAGRSPNLCARL